MDKAANKEDLMNKVADLLHTFDHVYYDADTLSYDGVMDEWIYEYGDYLDRNALADEWYAYRDSRMEDYVKSEMI